jgi:hypothetical protein
LFHSGSDKKQYFRFLPIYTVQYLTIWDLVLTPVYIVILVFIAKRYRDTHYPHGHPLRKYFLQGLLLKFGGAIFVGLVYQYYYGTGDTYEFFSHAKIINSSLDDSPTMWGKIMMRLPATVDPYIYKYSAQLSWYNDPPSYTIAVITAFFGLFNGTSYLPIALLFAFFSYTGIWAMYRTFVSIYPTLHKQLAYAFLFIPSTFVWGSGVFKDTVCMFGLGWMVYTSFRIFFYRDFSFKNLFLLVFSFYLVAVVKIYILMAFLPALALWLLLNYSHKIKIAAIRVLVNLLFVVFSIAGFFFVSNQFAQELNRYSLEDIATTSAVTRGWIQYASGEEGSAYDLGKFDPTILGMATKLPAAIAVTLYRPFVWEAKKPIVLLSALEALLFLGFTLYVLFKVGLSTAVKKIFSDPTVLFCFVFTIIFAFAVGISSYNFGALSRYKIPCLPFYAALLIIVFYKDKVINAAPAIKQKSRSAVLENT